MSEGIETAESARDALDRVTRALVAQAFALDEMFYRAAKEAFSTEDISYYHARTALKAQARCRATFKLLLALRRGCGVAEKISKFERRDYSGAQNARSCQCLIRTAPRPHACPVAVRRKGLPPPHAGSRSAQRRRLVPGAPRAAGLGDPHLATVAEIDRSADGRRKGPLGQKRAQARLEKQSLLSSYAATTRRVLACAARQPRAIARIASLRRGQFLIANRWDTTASALFRALFTQLILAAAPLH